METLAELLAILAEPGEDGLPDDLGSRIESVHNLAVEGADARIAELTETITALEGSVASLKAHNYDLMRAIPSTEPAEDTTDGDGDADKPKDFGDLFA